MTTPLTAQGVSITFRGYTLGRFVGIDGEFRSSPKTLHPIDGEVDAQGRYVALLEKTVLEESTGIEGYCTSVDRTLVGTTGQLSLTGSNWSWGFNAYLEDFKVTGRAGEYLRISFTFRRTST